MHDIERLLALVGEGKYLRGEKVAQFRMGPAEEKSCVFAARFKAADIDGHACSGESGKYLHPTKHARSCVHLCR